MNSSYGRNSNAGSLTQGYDIGPGDERSFSSPPSSIPVEMVYLVENPHGGLETNYRQVHIHRHQENGLVYEPIDMTPSTPDVSYDPRSIKHATNKIYYNEINRRETFNANWLDSYCVKPTDLARDGFIHTGPGDKVKCVFCLNSLRNWEPNDSVEGEHRKHYPDCPFVRGDCNDLNVSINPAENMKRSFGLKMKSTEESSAAIQMQDFSHRLQSFIMWPKHAHLRPDALAEAGLYYLGARDAVCCFACGVTIASWEPGDDPWVEHAKLSPDCAYVQTVKGSAYLNQNRVHLNDNKNSEQQMDLTSEPTSSKENNAEAAKLSQSKQSVNRSPQKAQSLLYPVQVSSAQSGARDTVRCFVCGSNLASWKPGDDPWAEHAKQSPYCASVQTVKGSPYVNENGVHLNEDKNSDWRMDLTNERTSSKENNAEAAELSQSKQSVYRSPQRLSHYLVLFKYHLHRLKKI